MRRLRQVAGDVLMGIAKAVRGDTVLVADDDEDDESVPAQDPLTEASIALMYRPVKPSREPEQEQALEGSARKRYLDARKRG